MGIIKFFKHEKRKHPLIFLKYFYNTSACEKYVYILIKHKLIKLEQWSYSYQ